MVDQVDILPVWKKDATAHERFLELARMAEHEPQRFRQVAIVWFGSHPIEEGYRYVTVGGDVHDALALFEIGQHLAVNWARKP